MNNKEESDKRPQIEIGDVSGQVIIGDDNRQVQVNRPAEAANLGNEKPDEAVSHDLKAQKLRQLLVDHFSISDLQDLCFDLSIDYEELQGGRKSDLARDLVVYCQRRGRLDELMTACRQYRPNAFS